MSIAKFVFQFSLLCVGLLVVVRPAAAVSGTELGIALVQELENRLTILPLVDQTPLPLPGRENVHISAVYNQHDAKPLWVDSNGPGVRAQVIRSFLEQAAEDGLEPEDYGVLEIGQEWSGRDPGALARLDVLLTRGLLNYIHDSRYGRIRPLLVDPTLFAEAGNEQFDSVAVMSEVLAVADLRVYLNALSPPHRYYKGLKKMLAHYRLLAAEGGWRKIPAGPTIRPDDQDKRIPAVRARLLASGDLEAGLFPGNYFDKKLERAVRRFQERHGLASDGEVGHQTRLAMNIPVDEVIRRIVLNMERWRWQEHELGERYLLVNIANYHLLAVAGGEVKLDMAVIVGQKQNQTPVFSDSIKYVELNPYWTLPPSIARDEYLPKLQRDARILDKRHIRLFSGWGRDARELVSTAINWKKVTPEEMVRFKLRQDPGPWNALGRAKFVFPNHYDIYLHDTPSRQLFNRAERGFSHGCVRVSYPIDLAGFVLDGERTGWDRERVEEVLAQGGNAIITTPDPLPVHITYQTTWLDKEGSFHLNKDIYGRDQRLVEALFPVMSPTGNLNGKEIENSNGNFGDGQ